MSDIPVGSPPAPPGRHAAPSGWYPDPVNGALERYWDGWQWSRTTRESEHPTGPAAGRRPGGAQPPAGAGQAPGPYGSANGSAPYGPPGSSGQQGQPGSYGPPGPHGQQDSQRPGQYGQAPNGQPGPYGAGQPGPYGPAAYGSPRPGRKPPVFTADGVPVAGWWWRVLAMVVDTMIVTVLTGVAAFAVYRRMLAGIAAWYGEVLRATQTGSPLPPQPSTTDLVPASDQLILTVVSTVVGLVFIVAFLRWKSATPGKLICGLRVVPVDQGRSTEKLSWATVIIRAAVWVLPGLAGLLLVVSVVDVLLPLWHPKRQALHDLAARTQVVKIN